jgi:DNA polymerase-3 subunit delta
MKIKPELLNNQLSKGLKSIYLVFGPEILLVEKSLQAIKDSAMALGFGERVRYDVDGHSSWDEIIANISSPSLFTQKRIIELRLATGKVGVRGSKAINELTASLPDDILLIVSAGKLDMAQQKSKWFKALDQNGTIIQHWEVQSEQLVGWIINHMNELGLKTDKNVANAIAYCTEGNLLATMQEIQKLKIAYPDGHIDTKEFLNQIDQQSHYSVFGLIDAALKGDAEKVNKIFTSLTNELTPPIIIISSLYREIKALTAMSVELQHNETIDKVLAKHRVWQKRKPLITNALKQHSYQGLQKLLLTLGRIDRSLKGMDNLNVYDELQSVLITLSGKRNGLNS